MPYVYRPKSHGIANLGGSGGTVFNGSLGSAGRSSSGGGGLLSVASGPGYQPPFSSGSRAPERGFPERIEPGGDQGLMPFIQTAAAAPGHTLERPIAIADKATGGLVGDILSGIGGFGLGEHGPEIGDLVNLAGEGIERVGNFTSAVINSQDYSTLEWIVQNGISADTVLPDWTGEKHTDGQFFQNLVGMGVRQKTAGEFLAELEKRGWNQGVLEDGTPGALTWDEVVSGAQQHGDLRSFQFGDKAVSDNQLLDMMWRIGTDPTNLAFGAGVLGKGATIARWATNPVTRLGANVMGKMRSVYGVGYAADMAGAGLRAAKFPSNALAARAVQAGRVEQATLKGLGLALSAPRRLLVPGTGSLATRYARGALRTEVGLLGVEYGSGTARNVLDQQTDEDANGPISGFFDSIHDLSKSLLADEPLSQNAAFNFAAAFALPAVPLLREDIGALRRGQRRAAGDPDVGIWAESYAPNPIEGTDLTVGLRRGFKQERDFVETLARMDRGEIDPRTGSLRMAEAEAGDLARGRQVFAGLTEHIQMRIAFRKLTEFKAVREHYESLDEALYRNQAVADDVRALASKMRERGDFKARDLMEEFEDWAAGRFETVVDREGNILRNVRQEVDFALTPPQRLEQYVMWKRAMEDMQSKFGPLTNGILGRAKRMTQEMIDDVSDALRAGADNGRVRTDFVRGLLIKYPAMFDDLSILSKGDEEFWRGLMNEGRAGIGDGMGSVVKGAAPTYELEGILSRLSALRRLSPKARELFHEVGRAERQASATAPTAGGPVSSGGFRRIYSIKQLREFRTMSNGKVRDLSRRLDAMGRDFDAHWTKRGNPRAAFRRQHPELDDAGFEALRTQEQQSMTALREEGSQVRKELREADTRLEEIRTTRVDPNFIDENGNPRVTGESLEALKEQTLYVRENYPAYDFEPGPKVALRYKPEDSHVAALLTERSNIARVLFDYGPLGRVTRFIDALAIRPVKNSKMAHDARQMVFNRLLPMGANPKKVDAFLAQLTESQRDWTIGKIQAPLFRGSTALPANKINAIAREIFEGDDKFLAAFKGRYGGEDRFHQMLDESANSLVRRVDIKKLRGERVGAFEQITRTGYWAWQHHLTGASNLTRHVSKFFYPMVRFQADLRWQALNQIEADIIAFFRDGLAATRFGRGRDQIARRGGKDVNISQQALAYHAGHAGIPIDPRVLEAIGQGPSLPASLHDDAGAFLVNANIAPVLRKTSNITRLENVDKALDEFAQNDNVIQQMIRTFGPEKAKWSDQLNEMLYSFDRRGVRRTVDETVRRVRKYEKWSQAEFDQMVPFVNRLVELNQKSFDDMLEVHLGNTSRTRLERVMNSYWLYWPISYQIKATKWMLGLMTNRAFGGQTNLGGALMLDRAAEVFRQQVATNPEFARQAKDNELLYFTASMLLPIAPWDFGQSLNRVVRYTGGNVLGLWPAYVDVNDPTDVIAKTLEMGPMYSAELLSRLADQFGVGQDNTDQRTPTANTLVGTRRNE